MIAEAMARPCGDLAKFSEGDPDRQSLISPVT
jgi:hypothetical protein